MTLGAMSVNVNRVTAVIVERRPDLELRLPSISSTFWLAARHVSLWRNWEFQNVNFNLALDKSVLSAFRHLTRRHWRLRRPSAGTEAICERSESANSGATICELLQKSKRRCGGICCGFIMARCGIPVKPEVRAGIWHGPRGRKEISSSQPHDTDFKPRPHRRSQRG
jgi:hypothetical protein